LATPADLVREACGQLFSLMGTLEELVAEPASTQNAAVGMSPRPADTPEPWDASVGRALMDGHEGVRRLEAVLRYTLNGHPGQRRGGSTGNTLAALDAIPKLAAGLPENDGPVPRMPVLPLLLPAGPDRLPRPARRACRLLRSPALG
jgi:hypothetical protein